MTDSKNLDPNILKRIAYIKCGQQIAEMSSTSLKIITNYFEEDYIRLLLTKSESPQNQILILEAITKAFDDIYLTTNEFGYQVYCREIPEFFDHLRLEFELGMPIESPLSSSNLHIPSATNESTPDEWIAVGHDFRNLLEQTGSELTEHINAIQAISEKSVNDINSLNNGIVSKLTSQLSHSMKKNQELRETISNLSKEIDTYKQWFEDWKKLKDEVATDCVNPLDIDPTWGENPTVMRRALQDMIAYHTDQLELKQENEDLRHKLAEWKDSPEYRKEIAKYKRAAKEKIAIESITEGLKNFARSVDSRGQVSELIMRLNIVLANTIWNQYAMPIYSELNEYYTTLENERRAMNNATYKDCTVYQDGSRHEDHSKHIGLKHSENQIENE